MAASPACQSGKHRVAAPRLRPLGSEAQGDDRRPWRRRRTASGRTACSTMGIAGGIVSASGAQGDADAPLPPAVGCECRGGSGRVILGRGEGAPASPASDDVAAGDEAGQHRRFLVTAERPGDDLAHGLAALSAAAPAAVLSSRPARRCRAPSDRFRPGLSVPSLRASCHPVRDMRPRRGLSARRRWTAEHQKA